MPVRAALSTNGQVYTVYTVLRQPLERLVLYLRRKFRIDPAHGAGLPAIPPRRPRRTMNGTARPRRVDRLRHVRTVIMILARRLEAMLRLESAVDRLYLVEPRLVRHDESAIPLRHIRRAPERHGTRPLAASRSIVIVIQSRPLPPPANASASSNRPA